MNFANKNTSLSLACFSPVFDSLFPAGILFAKAGCFVGVAVPFAVLGVGLEGRWVMGFVPFQACGGGFLPQRIKISIPCSGTNRRTEEHRNALE